MSPSPNPSTDLGAPVYFDPAASAPPPTDEEGELLAEPEIAPPDAEERGVRRAQLASLLSAGGIGLALVGPLGLLLFAGAALPFVGSLFGTALLTIGLIEVLLALLAVGAILQVVSFLLFGSSFGLLRWVDHRFRTPRALSWVGTVGFILLLLGMTGLLASLVVAVACAGGGGGSGCLSPSALEALGIVTLLGLPLAFVGWIGLLLGLYRSGSRYESPLLKASAILMIVPVANLVAPVLAYLSFRNVPRRFDLRPAAPEEPA